MNPRLAPWLAVSVLFGAVRAASAQTVAYYRFEEGSGTNVVNSLDSSVHGTHNATYSSNVPTATIPLTGASNGFSLQFNNSAAATITGQTFILHNTFGNATLEFWLNPANQVHSSILWTRSGATDTNRFNIAINPGGALVADYRSPTGVLHTLLSGATFTMPVDAWSHVAVTRTVDSPTQHTYRFYRDGALISTFADLNPDLPNSTAWTISGRAGFELQGFIDEIRFTNGALFPSQFLGVPEPGSLSTCGLAVAFLLLRAKRRTF